ncbi:hypothetical protein BgiMline_021734, partial [Biomphalaria glabrata]
MTTSQDRHLPDPPSCRDNPRGSYQVLRRVIALLSSSSLDTGRESYIKIEGFRVTSLDNVHHCVMSPGGHFCGRSGDDGVF